MKTYHSSEESLEVINQLCFLMAAIILMFIHLCLSQLINDVRQLSVDAIDAFVSALNITLQRVSETLLLLHGLLAGSKSRIRKKWAIARFEPSIYRLMCWCSTKKVI